MLGKTKIKFKKPSLSPEEIKAVKSKGNVKQKSSIPVDQLLPGRFQPRKRVSDSKIHEMAVSLKELGLLNPLIVRELTDNIGYYEILCGERRWRGAKELGWHDVNCSIKIVGDREAAKIALIDNLQREDLNPIEEAEALIKLKLEHGFTVEELARSAGRSRPATNNIMRLIDLTPEVQTMLFEEKISMGAGRALLAVPANTQLLIANRSIEESWSVRKVEQYCRELTQDKEEKNYELRVKARAQKFSTLYKVKSSTSINGTGKIELKFNLENEREMKAFFKKIGFNEQP